MENLENNKLIADFMGLGAQLHLVEHPETGEYVDAEYHTSWDWLMPVVEEIDHFQFEEVVEIETGLKMRSLSSTYNAVVEFIKQQNKNK